MARTLSVSQVLAVSNRTIRLTGGWGDCFGEIDRTGIVFVYGPSTSGKSSAALSLAKALTEHGRVLYASNEEGFRSSFQNRLRRLGVADCGTKIQFTYKEPLGDLLTRLEKRKSPDFVIVDSIQDSKIRRVDYDKLKQMSAKKMFVFVSRVLGKLPIGRLAVDIKFDADLKVWVEGGRAISQGRYIGPTGYCDVLEDKALKYWGIDKNKNTDEEKTE